MNIIIPIGGLGERFKNDNYMAPKPFIPIFGKKMIFHVLDNLTVEPDDQIIIIYSHELSRHDFKDVIYAQYPKAILIELTKKTDGAVETILFGLDKISQKLLKNRCVLLDCDTFYKTDILTEFRNKSENQNAVFCFKDVNDKPIFSYIDFQKTPPYIIHKIKEKIRISDYANSGCYCFASGETLKTYCQKIIDENIRERGEFYTSCVIDKMLEDGHRFDAIILDEKGIVCVGTPMQLKIYASSFAGHASSFAGHASSSGGYASSSGGYASSSGGYASSSGGYASSSGGYASSSAGFMMKNEKKRFCFDLDGTLVTTPVVPGDYSTVQPIQRNITMLNHLKSLGNYIIIHTARRMRTHAGNVGLVVKDIGRITLDTLAKYNISYDEIYFGKPHADYYIDDHAVSATADLEKELGFYSTNVKERDFNEIKTENMEIMVKRSTENPAKLSGEIYWYLNMPSDIQPFFPRLFGHGTDWYSMEKIHGITLSYLYVHESLTAEQLRGYLGILHRIHSTKPVQNQMTDNPRDMYDLYVKKIKTRYESYDYSGFPKSAEIYHALIAYFEKYESGDWGKRGVIHGDPVFSNCILTKNGEFKLFDMRGIIGDVLTLYGDILYDYAKVYQSLIGYDEILCGKTVSNEYREKMLRVFLEDIKENFMNENAENDDKTCNDIIKQIIMITNSLLFTLIPLHNNANCDKFYQLIMDI
jgi:capsule biosynthesis phosphatase